MKKTSVGAFEHELLKTSRKIYRLKGFFLPPGCGVWCNAFLSTGAVLVILRKALDLFLP